jgi:ankyrin repeat protein
MLRKPGIWRRTKSDAKLQEQTMQLSQRISTLELENEVLRADLTRSMHERDAYYRFGTTNQRRSEVLEEAVKQYLVPNLVQPLSLLKAGPNSLPLSYYLSRTGSSEAVRLFLELGLPMNVSCDISRAEPIHMLSDQLNPLEIAALHGHVSVMEVLHNQYPGLAKVGATDGSHLYHYAAIGGPDSWSLSCLWLGRPVFIPDADSTMIQRILAGAVFAGNFRVFADIFDCEIPDLTSSPYSEHGALDSLVWLSTHQPLLYSEWLKSKSKYLFAGLLASYSAFHGYTKVLDCLLKDQAQVMLSMSNNSSLGIAAAQAGDLETLKWLKSHGLDLSAGPSEDEKHTIGHKAASRGHFEVLKWMKSQGKFSWSSMNYAGRNVASYAAESGHIGILKWLVSENLVQSPSDWELFSKDVAPFAALGGHSRILHWLRNDHPTLKLWSEVDNSMAERVFVSMMEGGNEEVWEWFKTMPAKWKATASTVPVARFKPGKYSAELVKRFRLEDKSRLELNEDWYRHAIFECNFSLLQYLIAVGVPLPNFNTGLDIELTSAAVQGRIDIFHWILNQRRQLILNIPRRTALDVLSYCVFGGRVELIKWLMELGKPWNEIGSELVEKTILYSRPDVLAWLHTNDSSIDWKHHQATFPAAAHGNLNILKMLKAYGAELSSVNKEGETVLFEASRHDRIEILQWLHQNGVDLHHKSNAGRTPVMIASKSAKRWMERIDASSSASDV